jgi:hypothetical protein
MGGVTRSDVRVRRGRLGGSVRTNLSRAERYQELAVKYHELGKFARPPYLGDFYRGVAVRYVLMAQEAAERARRQGELGTEQTELPAVNYSPAHERNRTGSSTFRFRGVERGQEGGADR